jgi:hypothetical protein
MSTVWWLKATFLALLLITAAFFFGTLCRQMGGAGAYQVLIPPTRKLLPLLLRLLAAVGLVTVAAGIVTALLRPLWVACVAFALAGVAILLGWGVSRESALLTLLFVLAAAVYAAIAQNDLRKRIAFSVRALAQTQFILLVALLVLAVGSFYLGYAAQIRKEGLSIPLEHRERVANDLANRISSGFPEAFREGVRSVVHDQVLDLLSVQFSKAVEPFERYIPAGFAVVLFLPLLTVTYLLAWVPALLLGAIFPLLRAVGIVKVTTEMVEVKRLAIA